MTDQNEENKDEEEQKPAEKDDLPGLPPRVAPAEPPPNTPKPDELPPLPPR